MDALVNLEWRIYPASVTMALGAGLLLLGVRNGPAGTRLPTGHSDKMITVIQGFRVSVIGVALAGVGAAWAWHIVWLLVLSLVFGGEELLESTTHISILKRTLLPARPRDPSDAAHPGSTER